MKTNFGLALMCSTLGLVAASAGALAGEKLTVTVTNGSAMPISPALLYATDDETGLSSLGQMPSPGFVTLCQTGNSAPRATELLANKMVEVLGQTSALLYPGQSEAIEIEVRDARHANLHFEAMYGATKDTCSTFNVPARALADLGQSGHDNVTGSDVALATGAFADPAFGGGGSDLSACAAITSAVSCLRAIAPAATGTQKIRAFPGYLPSVSLGFEKLYGAAAAQSLIIPTSGGVSYTITR